jgi:hypothetical protein
MIYVKSIFAGLGTVSAGTDNLLRLHLLYSSPGHITVMGWLPWQAVGMKCC